MKLNRNKADILYGVLWLIFLFIAIVLIAYGTDAPSSANVLTVEHVYQAGWAFVFFTIMILPIWFIHRTKLPAISKDKTTATPVE